MSYNKIRMICFDIDGVLTDGCIYLCENGSESKRYRMTEIDALNDIKRMGYLIVAITGENTPIVEQFGKLIEWDQFVTGCKDKEKELKRMEQEYGINRETVCYIGDGKYDLEAIKYAGLGVCPVNAIAEVKEVADVVLEGRGGESCIYELYQLLRDMHGENQQ